MDVWERKVDVEIQDFKALKQVAYNKLSQFEIILFAGREGPTRLL